MSEVSHRPGHLNRAPVAADPHAHVMMTDLQSDTRVPMAIAHDCPDEDRLLRRPGSGDDDRRQGIELFARRSLSETAVGAVGMRWS